MKHIFCAVMVLGLAGCSGHVVTMDRLAACKKDDASGGTVCRGVPYRMSVPKDAEVMLVRTVDAEGKTVLSADAKEDAKKCTPMKAVTTKAKASKTVSFISYEPGFLEYANFDVTLTPDGTISKVGAVSTSTVKDSADAISTLAAAYLALRAPSVQGFIPEGGAIIECNAEASD